MKPKTFYLFLLLSCFSCNNNSSASNNKSSNNPSNTNSAGADNPYVNIAAIPLPAGFKRMESDSSSFAKWLLNVKLKKDKTVHIYDGRKKANQSAQFAVLDISTGDKDLQQCADAVMRLRAEYLYANEKFAQIIFTDNEGKTYHFNPPYNRQNFQQYLNRVFGMCGSASLSKQLNTTAIETIEAGDVFIRGGFPGHAVIVMDVATNNAGEKVYLLAQSYMPAQDIHILVNPNNKSLSPWYKSGEADLIETPEYTFTKRELKKW